MAADRQQLASVRPQTMHEWFSVHRRDVLLGTEAVIIVGALLLLGYGVDWTGFAGKTLWNWMDLLVVPIALAVIGFYLRRQESQNQQSIAEQRRHSEQEIADDRLQAAVLESFQDLITGLILKEHLKTSEPDDDVRKIARARTLTALTRLDERRKGRLINFLYGTRLVTSGDAEPAIALMTSTLSGALEGIDQPNAVIALDTADLSHVDLMQAFLPGVMLINSDLRHANLRGADLGGAFFTEAVLDAADLKHANLRVADLRCSSLCQAHTSPHDG